MTKVSSSPHFHSRQSTRGIMLTVAAALVPSWVWGIYSFGARALVIPLVSIATAVLTEWLLGLVSHESTIGDCSAVVTGLILGLNVSPLAPVPVVVIASVFAIAVVKWIFGGLGCNWMNPALGGRVFVFFSFTSAMSHFQLPRQLASGVDALSSATTLSLAKTAIASGDHPGMGLLEILAGQGYPATGFAKGLAARTGLDPYTVDAFFGNMAGCIGETSALLILLGGIALLCAKVITWHIPVAYIVSYALANFVFGGLPSGEGLMAGAVVDPLFRGGLMLGAFFMATDYATTPLTRKGQLVFGVGCGLLTFLFRSFGSLPEGASLAIILMNIATPTIDRFVKPRKFGYVKPAKGARK